VPLCLHFLYSDHIDSVPGLLIPMSAVDNFDFSITCNQAASTQSLNCQYLCLLWYDLDMVPALLVTRHIDLVPALLISTSSMNNLDACTPQGHEW